MISKKEIITKIDMIVGLNNDVTDDTHMDLVDEISDYIEDLVRNSYTKADVIKAYDDGFNDGNQRDFFSFWEQTND